MGLIYTATNILRRVSIVQPDPIHTLLDCPRSNQAQEPYQQIPNGTRFDPSNQQFSCGEAMAEFSRQSTPDVTPEWDCRSLEKLQKGKGKNQE
jgi:hypothetical protein